MCIPRALLLLMCLLLTWQSAAVLAQAQPAPVGPYDQFSTGWREDAVWHDGKAEWAEYDAVRMIYGEPRRYTARIITNAEHASPDSKTKAADGTGRAVFKQHVREDVPTQAYNYHFSTMCYVGRSDLKSLKIDMGSQEDCGASFKQVVNHLGEAHWTQFSYFPDEGHQAGVLPNPPQNLIYHDALPIVLRGYPFGPQPTLQLQLLPDTTTNKWSPMSLTPVTVSYVGRETLDLPIGEVEAHHLRVRAAEADAPVPGVDADLWFHTDGSAPLLHVLVQYRDALGTDYKLSDHRRWAYWAVE